MGMTQPSDLFKVSRLKQDGHIGTTPRYANDSEIKSCRNPQMNRKSSMEGGSVRAPSLCSTSKLQMEHPTSLATSRKYRKVSTGGLANNSSCALQAVISAKHLDKDLASS